MPYAHSMSVTLLTSSPLRLLITQRERTVTEVPKLTAVTHCHRPLRYTADAAKTHRNRRCQSHCSNPLSQTTTFHYQSHCSNPLSQTTTFHYQAHCSNPLSQTTTFHYQAHCSNPLSQTTTFHYQSHCSNPLSQTTTFHYQAHCSNPLSQTSTFHYRYSENAQSQRMPISLQ